MKFRYQGYDRSGAGVSAQIAAPDEAGAREQLARKGVAVSELARVRETGAPSGGGGFGSGKRREQVAAFLRQLSVLVETGTPLVEAITSIERQLEEGPWKATLARVRERLEEGAQLSDSMAAHPAYFDPVCRSLIAAGESGGKLGDMLSRLAVFMRQQVKLRRTVTGAMAYPCLLICVAFVVVVAMLGFVMPRFEGLFKSIDAKLPPTTEMLMGASAFVRAHWYYFVALAGAAPFAAWLWLRTHTGRSAAERAMIRAPLLGPVTRAFATAKLARVLGVLLEGRVPMLDALRLTRSATGRDAYARLVARAEDAVTRGESILGAFSDPTLINPSVTEAIRSGERTGRVGAVLVQIADHMDEDNDMALKAAVGLLEPLILIGLGLVVGVMAISMFLPLFDLAASGGGAH